MERPSDFDMETCMEEHALGYKETGEVASGSGVHSGMKISVCGGVGWGDHIYDKRGNWISRARALVMFS